MIHSKLLFSMRHSKVLRTSSKLEARLHLLHGPLVDVLPGGRGVGQQAVPLQGLQGPRGHRTAVLSLQHGRLLRALRLQQGDVVLSGLGRTQRSLELFITSQHATKVDTVRVKCELEGHVYR